MLILRKELCQSTNRAPFGKTLYSALKTEYTAQKKNKLKYGDYYTIHGQYTSTDSFKYCSRIIHNELGLAFDYHPLRHTTHATMLIEAGANVKDVQTRLGHTNITTTLQTYVHDTEKMGEQSVELFESITAVKSS